MFCHKCGAEILEKAAFCHKCGAKILDKDVKAESVHQNGVMKPGGPGTSQRYRTESASGKKKSDKLLKIICAVIAAICILNLLIGESDTKVYESASNLDSTDLDSANSGFLNLDSADLDSANSDFLNLDSNLYGRWRSFDGGCVEFGMDGYANVDFRAWEAVYSPDYIIWEANNGQITLYSHYDRIFDYEIIDYEWDYREWEYGSLDAGSKQELHLKYPNGVECPTYTRSELGDSIVGTWEYTQPDSLVLLSDGTGSYRQYSYEVCPIDHWYADDSKFEMDWYYTRYIDYSVTGNVLTIYFNDGAKVYEKVGN